MDDACGLKKLDICAQLAVTGFRPGRGPNGQKACNQKGKRSNGRSPVKYGRHESPVRPPMELTEFAVANK
jgi:hypothetical protein